MEIFSENFFLLEMSLRALRLARSRSARPFGPTFSCSSSEAPQPFRLCPLIPKADSFWTFLAELACGSRVVSGSASALGRTTQRLRGMTQKIAAESRWSFPCRGRGSPDCARGRTRSPRRSREDRHSKIHNDLPWRFHSTNTMFGQHPLRAL